VFSSGVGTYGKEDSVNRRDLLKAALAIPFLPDVLQGGFATAWAGTVRQPIFVPAFVPAIRDGLPRPVGAD